MEKNRSTSLEISQALLQEEITGRIYIFEDHLKRLIESRDTSKNVPDFVDSCHSIERCRTGLMIMRLLETYLKEDLS